MIKLLLTIAIRVIWFGTGKLVSKDKLEHEVEMHQKLSCGLFLALRDKNYDLTRGVDIGQICHKIDVSAEEDKEGQGK